MTIPTASSAAVGGQRPAEQGPTPDWYAMTVADVVRAQDSDIGAGLSTEGASARLARFGRNVFSVARKEPGWRAFLRQFRDPMQIVLLVAAAVSGVAIRQWGTALLLISVALLSLALLNAIMGLNQEGKAEASIAAL